MRVGEHPGKEAGALPAYGRHRVIVPVHIPAMDGYFAESRAVLDRCLESLRLSAGGRVAVTIVSDGSCPPVIEDLQACVAAGWVDQLVVNEPNRGKVDSVVSAARAAFEPLVTISDADILFRAGWVDAVEEVFATFPECGFASLFPSPPGAFHLTSATLLGAAWRRELGVEPVAAPADLDRFATSIGRPDLFPHPYREVQLVVQRRGTSAAVGAPHWVLTVRRAVIDAMPPEPSRRAVGDSESRWLDQPADQAGLWRLSTNRAFAQHMGNAIEPWMDEELEALRQAVDGEPVEVDPGDPRRAGDESRWGRGRGRWSGRLPAALRTQLAHRVVRPRIERRLQRAATTR